MDFDLTIECGRFDAVTAGHVLRGTYPDGSWLEVRRMSNHLEHRTSSLYLKWDVAFEGVLYRSGATWSIVPPEPTTLELARRVYQDATIHCPIINKYAYVSLGTKVLVSASGDSNEHAESRLRIALKAIAEAEAK